MAEVVCYFCCFSPAFGDAGLTFLFSIWPLALSLVAPEPFVLEEPDIPEPLMPEPVVLGFVILSFCIC